MADPPTPNPASGARAPTSALFVRIPTSEADKLDRASFELKAPKQDLVTGLVARYVDPSSPKGLDALRDLALRGRPRAGSRRVTVETTDDSLTVGRHSFRASEPREVMTLDDVSGLLEVAPDALRELAEAGAIPGRRIGGEWRFSRRAVLEWLGAGEPDARGEPQA